MLFAARLREAGERDIEEEVGTPSDSRQTPFVVQARETDTGQIHTKLVPQCFAVDAVGGVVEDSDVVQAQQGLREQEAVLDASAQPGE